MAGTSDLLLILLLFLTYHCLTGTLTHSVVRARGCECELAALWQWGVADCNNVKPCLKNFKPHFKKYVTDTSIIKSGDHI